MRLAGLAKGGYYPTPMRCVDLMTNFIRVTSPTERAEHETMRILDPCCGPGDACERLAARLKARRKIPSFYHDPEYRRLRFVRYADDFLLGFIGSKAEARRPRATSGPSAWNWNRNGPSSTGSRCHSGADGPHSDFTIIQRYQSRQYYLLAPTSSRR